MNQQIIILREKHATRYISTTGGLEATCRAIIEERIGPEGWLYLDDDIEKAKRVLASPPATGAALRWLRSRARLEYEGFEIDTLEDMPPHPVTDPS